MARPFIVIHGSGWFTVFHVPTKVTTVAAIPVRVWGRRLARAYVSNTSIPIIYSVARSIAVEARRGRKGLIHSQPWARVLEVMASHPKPNIVICFLLILVPGLVRTPVTCPLTSRKPKICHSEYLEKIDLRVEFYK